MTDPLATAAANRPDHVGLVDASNGDRWTFKEYDAAVTAAAERLAGLGIEAGDSVALLTENRPEFAHVFFACWRLGAVAVPLNARLTAVELRAQIDVVEPPVVVSSERYADVPGDSARKRDVYTFESARDEAASFEDVRRSPLDPSAASRGTDDPVDGTDVAYLFTSGTTGSPKVVRVTTANFEAASKAHRKRIGVEATDRWLCPLSTYHMGGLAVLVRSAFYATTAVLQRTANSFDADRTRRVLETHDCTAVSVVPVMLRRLLDDGPLPDSLRFVLCGGAPTPRQLVERAASMDVPVCPTYGMTETTSQVATPPPGDAPHHPDSVGRPLDGVDVALLDGAEDQVAPGELGEIVVSGPTVTPGYLDGDRSAFGTHGFHTGDVARMDEDGRLYVLNRREDRILTGGENVHPGEVAAVLLDHPTVAEAVVLGTPDDDWGERVSALVVTEPGNAVRAEALRAFARERLAGYKIPRTIEVVDELPRTASGTVDRELAREHLERHRDG